MSGILSQTYDVITSSSLATSLYDGASSFASGVEVDLITAAGFFGLNICATLFGATVSALTGGRVHLNHFVPQSIRDFLQDTGGIISDLNQGVRRLITKVLKVNNSAFLSVAIVAPIIEEAIFRFPLLLASLAIDAVSSEFTTFPLLKGAIELGGEALKVALAMVLSIGFTYAHESNPEPGRVASLFVSGLALSYLTLQPTGGLRKAMAVHAIHNLVPNLLELDKMDA